MPSNALPVAKIDESQSSKKRDRKTVGTVFSLSLLSRLVFVSPAMTDAKQAASLVSCRRHLILLYFGPPNAPHPPDIAATFRGEDYANYHFLYTELRSPIASLEATHLLDRNVPCLQCSVNACDCFDCLELREGISSGVLTGHFLQPEVLHWSLLGPPSSAACPQSSSSPRPLLATIALCCAFRIASMQMLCVSSRPRDRIFVPYGR